MKFRPCIDIHDGKVKQIVGSTLNDAGTGLSENFVAQKGAGFYADKYKSDGLTGGHIILLNKAGTPEYEASKAAAFEALEAYPGGLQVGGGVSPDNATDFLDAGASHVIVTSYVFNNGRIDMEALQRISGLVGREHLVLDLSCKRVGNDYHIVTERWQNISKEVIDYGFLDMLSEYCDEYLIHAADVEGKKTGIDRDLAYLMGRYKQLKSTYAGGVTDYADIELISYMSDNWLDFTIGSALDLFGGHLSYDRILKQVRDKQ